MMRIFLMILMALTVTPSAVAAVTKVAETPITKLDVATEKIMSGLDANETLQFQKIREAHGTLRAVADAEQALSRAVSSCSSANPDMADTMTGAIKNWRDQVDPVVTAGQARLDEMITLQKFAKTKDLRAYLGMFDEAVVYRNHLVTEVPISDEGACQKLIGKMTKSARTMGGLITEKLGLDQPLNIIPPR